MTNSGKDKPRLVAPKRDFKNGKPARAKKKASKPAAKKNRRSGPTAKGRPRGFIRGMFAFIFRAIWWITFRVAIVGVLILAGATAYYYGTLPPADQTMDGRTRGSVTMLDNNGEVFAWRGNQFGGRIRVENVSPHLKHAIVATEDKRFYGHFGISPRGIAGAVRINLSEGRGALQGHGGSTITQQVAKLLCLGVPYDPTGTMTERQYEADCRRSSKTRKLKEIPYSMAMELKYGKDAILSIYLNRAYLGAGAHGFEAASQRYFGISATEVNPSQAAMLAGLLTAPSRFAPTSNLQRSQNRANLVIGLMEDQGYLSAAEAEKARTEPATLSTAAATRAGDYFADWIMEAGPSFLTKATTEDVVIRTTFDGRIQKATETALSHIFETKVKAGSKAQAAIVVMSRDGAVRAMVGGRENGVAGQFNRATQALRQTGSSFKPFVYAAALEDGYSYNSVVVDKPLTIDIPGSGPWSPKNYTHKFYGPMTFTQALAQSINTAAVRISEEVGRSKVRALARDFGINSPLAEGPALALGASESTLLEMTGAYAGILNSGHAATPYGLIDLRLLGDDTPLMGTNSGTGARVINDRAASELIYMMNQVVEVGSGRRAQLGNREAAGKTGTTQGARDAWFIGFTADYVAGVWMGYDDNSKLTGVTGGGLPADIWRETMLRIHEGVPATPLPMIHPSAEQPLAQTLGLDTGSDTARDRIENQKNKRRRDKQKRQSEVETIFNQLLNNLFGKKN